MRTGFASPSWTGWWMLLSLPASSISANPTQTSFGLRSTSPRRPLEKWFTSKIPRCSPRSPKAWEFEAFSTQTSNPPAQNWLRSDCRMTNPSIPTINGGSSSIQFGLYQAHDLLKRGLQFHGLQPGHGSRDSNGRQSDDCTRGVPNSENRHGEERIHS